MFTKTYQLNDIEAVAEIILQNASSKLLLFDADMGVGKTTLIKALVKSLGSMDDVKSPTFSLVNEYETTNSSAFHFDLYRIEDEEEALNFGIEDYLNTDHWIFMEWPDKILDLLPSDFNTIQITLNPDFSRTLVLKTNNKELTNKKYGEKLKII
ncbi:MAG: tRNA (adenosine(37)-N6)-threonylcarbamoyltransferase complex ATPase subunit type 1 TsaE [Bacteroidetes bacterium MedPE-SWsnd-G2]|nr:MAG: tRNA (adenosine(37)-N6)-threonylcarbamoyltransferase complex ATPase subunit type 1 TsaE [Bacteroidetes bacterium MedPE-SWsnd-G2]